MIAIYGIINNVNGKVYVGASVDIRTRWNQHRSELRRDLHGNRHLQRAWIRYGEASFDFFILEQVPSSELLQQYEQKWIDELKVLDRDRGYNIGPAGKEMAGRKHSPEAIAKMMGRIPGNKGKPMTDEQRARLSAAMTGKKLSAERKAKLVMSNTGRTHSEETKQKMSEWRTRYYAEGKGKPVSDETRARMSASRKRNIENGIVGGMLGKTHSDATKDKISAAFTEQVWRVHIQSQSQQSHHHSNPVPQYRT